MKYSIQHIPQSPHKRPGIFMFPKYLTIHSTGNHLSTAQNERDWLTNPENDRQASWHICIDENEAVEAIPLDEVAWHAGDGRGNGNMASISIEMCESGDRAKVLQHTINQSVKLLRERGWGVDRLRRHYDWSGKICPRIFADDDWALWQWFKAEVKKKLADKIKINLHGQEMFIDGELKDGVTRIPIRFLEQLGYKVDWVDGVIKINYK